MKKTSALKTQQIVRLALGVSALLLASCGLSGCGKVHQSKTVVTAGIEALPPAASGSFSSVYQGTLRSACIECHVPGGSAGTQLDFSDPASAYRTLTGASVSGGSSAGICGGVRIVAPGDPSASYLAAVLFAEYNSINFAGVAGCQPYTAHLQDQNLSGGEKASILAWIQKGARND